MPLYEYACEKCGQKFEVIQKFSDEPLTTHETCGGHVERLISAPAFHFKGSGWYITDYAKDKKSASNGQSGKTEGSEAKPSESKPAESTGEKKDSTPAPTTTSSSSESK